MQQVLPRAYDVGIKAASFKKWPAQKGIRNKWLLAHEGAPSKVLITAPPGLADALPLCEFDKLCVRALISGPSNCSAIVVPSIGKPLALRRCLKPWHAVVKVHLVCHREDFAGCSRLNCLFACRMQQNTPAKRLEIIMSSRAKAQSAGVTNEPRQLAPATSDAAEDLEAMQVRKCVAVLECNSGSPSSARALSFSARMQSS